MKLDVLSDWVTALAGATVLAQRTFDEAALAERRARASIDGAEFLPPPLHQRMQSASITVTGLVSVTREIGGEVGIGLAFTPLSIGYARAHGIKRTEASTVIIEIAAVIMGQSTSVCEGARDNDKERQ
jgi:hypothetical protein